MPLGPSAMGAHFRDTIHHAESPMKLFYSPGACSLSPRIALREAGTSFEAVKVGRDK